MGMIMDMIHSLKDMKQLASLEGAIEGEINTLEQEGKLPDDLKSSFEALKNAKNEGGNVESSLEPLKNFVAELEKHEDLFPDNIKNVVAKFENITQDLEGIAGDIDKKTGNQ